MTTPRLLLLLPLLAAAAVCAPAVGDAPPEGLALVLTTKQKEVWPNGSIEWDLSLVNRSKTATHPVVLPGDGSESGWREPHVFFTATHVGKDGVEKELKARGIGRCGLYAHQWWNDVVKLAPGESRKLESYPFAPQAVFDWQEEGRLRLVAHYVWKGGRKKSDPQVGDVPPADLGGMRGVLPFELVSEPVELTVVRPLEVVAKSRGVAFKAGVQARLSDVIEARVVNRSDAATDLDPGEWTVSFTNDAAAHVWPVMEGVDGGARAPTRLAAGAETALVGKDGFPNSRDVKLRFETAGTARLAVVLCRSGPNSAAVWSNWVEVKIEE